MVALGITKYILSVSSLFRINTVPLHFYIIYKAYYHIGPFTPSLLCYSCLTCLYTWKTIRNIVFLFSTVKHVFRNSRIRHYFIAVLNSHVFPSSTYCYFFQHCQLAGPYICIGLIVEFSGMTVACVYSFFYRNQNAVGRLLITDVTYIFFNKFIYFIFGCVGSSLLLMGFSLAVASGDYSSLRCVGFSLQWLLLLQSTGSRHVGFSSCGTWAQ